MEWKLCVAEARDEMWDVDRNVDGAANWLMEAKLESVI